MKQEDCNKEEEKERDRDFSNSSINKTNKETSTSMRLK